VLLFGKIMCCNKKPCYFNPALSNPTLSRGADREIVSFGFACYLLLFTHYIFIYSLFHLPPAEIVN